MPLNLYARIPKALMAVGLGAEIVSSCHLAKLGLTVECEAAHWCEWE